MERFLLHLVFMSMIGLVAGKVEDWLDVEYLLPLVCIFREIDGKLNLAFVFDYSCLRYHLVVAENVPTAQCVENVALGKYANGVDKGCTVSDALMNKCLDVFWPYFCREVGQSKERKRRD